MSEKQVNIAKYPPWYAFHHYVYTVSNCNFGKPANTRCVQLADNFLCKIFTSPLRPKVCASLQASREMCFTHRDQALTYLIKLEADTAP